MAGAAKIYYKTGIARVDFKSTKKISSSANDREKDQLILNPTTSPKMRLPTKGKLAKRGANKPIAGLTALINSDTPSANPPKSTPITFLYAKNMREKTTIPRINAILTTFLIPYPMKNPPIPPMPNWKSMGAKASFTI